MVSSLILHAVERLRILFGVVGGGCIKLTKPDPACNYCWSFWRATVRLLTSSVLAAMIHPWDLPVKATIPLILLMEKIGHHAISFGTRFICKMRRKEIHHLEQGSNPIFLEAKWVHFYAHWLVLAFKVHGKYTNMEWLGLMNKDYSAYGVPLSPLGYQQFLLVLSAAIYKLTLHTAPTHTEAYAIIHKLYYVPGASQIPPSGHKQHGYTYWPLFECW